MQSANPLPTLSQINPHAALANSDDLSVTIHGANFVNSSLVRWNGSDRQTTFVSDAELKALIPASDLSSPGTANITVFNPAPGGGLSNPLAFSINQENPVPTLTNINPGSVTAGSGDFTLTMTGANFGVDSVVRWNGADRVTTFVNHQELTALITAADIASAGTASITVFNPAPGGGTSGAMSLTINATNPVPVLTGIMPDTVPAGVSTFTLTVNGSGFVSGSVIRWNGANRRTTFVSDTKLTTAVPGSLVTDAGTASITVFSPLPDGGTSNELAFTISATNPPPVLSSISPTNTPAGSGDFTLTLSGSNFVNGAAVQWNGNNRPTTFVSFTELKAAIPASDLAQTGTALLTVSNPAPGGGVSATKSFEITPPPNPVPSISSLAPGSIAAGADNSTVTINGTGFVADSVVRWNGSDRATTFVSSTQLRALITDVDLVNPGTGAITVFNPAPGGGLSSSVNFTIFAGNPVPTLTSLDPPAAPAGSNVLTLTINGYGFVAGAIVRWNGGTRRTTFISDTQLTATITLNDLASPGTGFVTVFNPAPDGGLSNELSFAITPATNPVPTLTNVSPQVIAVGSNDVTLTVSGINFVFGSVVRWNGQDRPTTFVSNGTLTAQLPAADLLNPGAAAITAFNPAPGGGTSNPKGISLVGQLVNVSATRYVGGKLAAESIVAAFGSGLAATTQSATTLPLPASLSGTTVVITDSAGNARNAPLFFVSPTQINYQIPPGTAAGSAAVTVIVGDEPVASGTIQIVAVAPGVFSADASGHGLAAALALRTRADGTQSWESVGQFDAEQNRFVSLPIDPGSVTEQVHLVLFGSGFRQRSNLTNVSASIAGITLPAQFAGAQGELAGLDQANVLLPASLQGRGEVEVILIVDGLATNPVRVTIR